MSTQNHRTFRARQDERRFLWLVEQEKFRNNIKNLQMIAEDLAVQRQEFNNLFAETQMIRAETRSLQHMINKTALKLGLEPFDLRKNNL
jgi:hypothetical protein